jgi:hypothetical protein
MAIPNNNATSITTSSFLVDSKNTNADAALSICKILSTITSLNDAAIVAILGTLDFNKIMLEYFNLDFVAKAFKGDIVTFQSYVHILPDNQLEITVSGNKKQGSWEVPIVNGSFVFAVRQGIQISYSLS